MVALDASALIAYMFHEPGRDIVVGAIGESCMSAVNYAEVITRFARDRVDVQPVREAIDASPVEVVPFHDGLAYDTGRLIAMTDHRGLSLGDRACLALASARGIPALTADRVWANLGLAVDIRLIR